MTSSRYYELDWLRIILILGVFLHHSLMPFNGDDWHIMNADSSGLLDDMMVYFEQFRLPALFFIAGAGALLLLNKRKPVAFMKDKVMRLLLPLLVGVIFIVPPQSYIENMTDYSSYVSAYPQLLVNFDANHLWFIEFLFVFMLLAIPLYQLFNKILISEEVQNRIVFFNNAFYVLFIGVLIGLSRVVLRLYYPEDDHSIFNPAVSLFYLMFFVLGMVFISNPQYWKSLEINRRFNLYILIIISILFYAYYWLDFSPYFSLQTRWSIWWFLGALLSWSGLLTLCGYAQRYLARKNRYLIHSNRFIYPFYIFHQTVIILFGYWIIQIETSLMFKALFLTCLSLITTVAICRFCIAPFKTMRFLFGIRN